MKRIYFVIFCLLFSMDLFPVDITVKNRNGTVEIKHYDDLIKKLHFYKSEIISISNLENMEELKSIRFEMTAELHDFSFLAGLDMVEELFFQDVTIDNIDFLYKMQSLKNIVIQGCKVDKKIDASRVPNLEYFEFSNAGLTEFPLIVHGGKKLKTINVAYNKITDIQIDENIVIIATGNPLKSHSKNILLGDLFEVLPNEYHKYIR